MRSPKRSAAGIRVVMLTGDHAVTARAIAAQAGIARTVPAWSPAPDSTRWTMTRWRNARDSTDVFARVRPEQKLRLVEGAQARRRGRGDDRRRRQRRARAGGRAYRHRDGRRGTDVAREAAAIVLLDDDFVTIVRAIRLGRRIYDNIRHAMRYILAVHVPIAGLALLPLLRRAAGAVAAARRLARTDHRPGLLDRVRMRAAAADIMRRPPRPPTRALLGLRQPDRDSLWRAPPCSPSSSPYIAGRSLALPSAQLGALAFTAWWRQPRPDHAVPLRRVAVAHAPHAPIAHSGRGWRSAAPAGARDAVAGAGPVVRFRAAADGPGSSHCWLPLAVAALLKASGARAPPGLSSGDPHDSLSIIALRGALHRSSAIATPRRYRHETRRRKNLHRDRRSAGHRPRVRAATGARKARSWRCSTCTTTPARRWSRRTAGAAAPTARYWHVDVASERAVQRRDRRRRRALRRACDVLVNNAGIAGANKPTHEITEAEWDRVQAINVKGVFFCTKHAIPHLRARRRRQHHQPVVDLRPGRRAGRAAVPRVQGRGRADDARPTR